MFQKLHYIIFFKHSLNLSFLGQNQILERKHAISMVLLPVDLTFFQNFAVSAGYCRWLLHQTIEHVVRFLSAPRDELISIVDISYPWRDIQVRIGNMAFVHFGEQGYFALVESLGYK